MRIRRISKPGGDGRARTILALLATALVAGAASATLPVAATPTIPNGTLLTLGGSAGAGRGTTVAADPVGLAGGPGGGVLVSDGAADVVRLLSPSGTETLVAGNNLANYNGDVRAATSASLASPLAVVLDHRGDVIVADSYDNRVRLVAGANCASACPFGLPSMTAGWIYTVAGDGTAGFAGDGAKAISAELSTPSGLAFDPSGDLLIADTYNSRIRLVAAANCSSHCAYGLASTVAGDIYTVAGDGVIGYVGNGTKATAAELALPTSVTVDASGDVVIADSANNRVRLVAWQSGTRFGLPSLTAGDIYTISGDGTVGGSLGNNGPGIDAELDAPAGVTVDQRGDVLVADTLDQQVRLVAASSCSSSCPFGLKTVAGNIYAVAGDATAGFAGDGGPARSAELQAPSAVYVDGAGNLLVADSGNNRVRVVAAAACGSGCDYGAGPVAAGDIYSVGGDGRVGYSGDGGSALAAELSGPQGVALDGQDNVLVADSGDNRVRVVAQAACAGRCPYGLGPMAAGAVYTIAGNGTAAFYGDGGRATAAELDDPGAVAPAFGGGAAVADTRNNRVRLVASQNCASNCPYGLRSTHAGFIYTIAGNGLQGYSGDGGRGTSAGLFRPTSLALGPLGDLLIADTGNNRVRLLAAVTCRTGCPYGLATVAGDIYTVAGNGALGFTGDGGPARSAAFGQPGGVAVGLSGALLISDTLNNRVRMLATEQCTSACPYGLASTSPGDVYTIAGDGSFGFAGDRGPARSAALADPAGLAVDAAGNVYLADLVNERIRVVSNQVCLSACRFGVPSMSVGSIATVVGNGNLAVSPNSAAANTESLAAPTSVAVDPTGALVFVESASGTVRRVYPSPTDGFVIVTSVGNVYAYGAPNDGGLNGRPEPAPIIGIAADNLAGGYWLVGTDGSVYPFGGALSYGSMRGKHLNEPIVAISPTADGRGYWLVASDGGIFAFGDAKFHGSMGGKHLNKPIVGMATSPDGRGYWLVATDGGMFTFGDAKYRGSEGCCHLNRPIYAMDDTPDGAGYWLVAQDGGIFTFGDAHYHGSLGGFVLHSSIVGVSADPLTGGYRMVDQDGRVYPFACPSYGGGSTAVPHPLVAIATSH